MRMVQVAKLKAGMVLAQNVSDKYQRHLLSSGTALLDSHIALMQRVGVAVVAIESDDEAGGNGGTPREDRPDLFNAFALADLEHPLTHALYDLRVRVGPGPTPSEAAPLSQVTGGMREPQPPEAIERGEKVAGALIQTVRTLVSPSAVYNRLVEVMNHALSSASDIADVIATDQGLTARLLRLVNSSLYAPVSPIDSVTRAVAVIGTRELSNLALATSVVRQFRNIPGGLLDPESFWRHNFAVALTARYLGEQTEVSDPEALFTAGILHDVGRAVLLMHFGAAFSASVERARREGRPLYEAERLENRCDHAAMGAAFLEMWSLPAVHVAVAGGHHAPRGGSPFAREVALVHVADHIANALHWGASGQERVPPLDPGAWERTRLSTECVGALPGVVLPQIDEATLIFLNDD